MGALTSKKEEGCRRLGETHVRPPIPVTPKGSLTFASFEPCNSLSPTPGNSKGPRHLAVLTILEIFQTMKDLLTMPLPPMPRKGRLLHQHLGSLLASVPSKGKQMWRPTPHLPGTAWMVLGPKAPLPGAAHREIRFPSSVSEFLALVGRVTELVPRTPSVSRTSAWIPGTSTPLSKSLQKA